MNSVSWLIQWFLEEDPVRQTSTSVDRRTQQQTWEKVLWFSVIKLYIQSVSLHPLSFHPTSFICSLCLRFPVECLFYISLCVFSSFSLPMYFRFDIIFSPPTSLFSHFFFPPIFVILLYLLLVRTLLVSSIQYTVRSEVAVRGRDIPILFCKLMSGWK